MRCMSHFRSGEARNIGGILRRKRKVDPNAGSSEKFASRCGVELERVTLEFVHVCVEMRTCTWIGCAVSRGTTLSKS